ncbi:putative bifunctional diguanylate cyclase/phosphodiesterase [Trinickia dinghuensis]|uniref:EAL domain-containing protein n=1 Tax=Trinickia dinghuensis TaxID=2291023 RepID=A0A3D8K4E8_9BURK|nr:EAL domain-containing protein [Trinickia dinghuensis]RDV00304.1 EAL domain-containing protein [Trinickia dinghuensis]
MIPALYTGLARTVGRWRQHYLGIDRRLPITTLMVVAGLAMLASGVGYTVTWRAHSNAQRIHALRTRNDIDNLQALYLSANADFLEGLGTARVASYAWPVPRVGAAVRCFRRLQAKYANDPEGTAAIQLLRDETARWSWQLAQIAVNARLAGGRASVDSVKLLEANRLLAQIATQLDDRRQVQTEILRSESDSANQHMAIEGIVLALTGMAACVLLGYAFLAHYRAGLARQRVHLIEAENERRFREYFDNHPLPMLIFDIDTLEIITANLAAEPQYGYSRNELCARDMPSLYAPADVPAFLHDLRSLREAGTLSGAAGVCRHRRDNGSTLYVDLSYHLLTYARREACFITAIDVTEKIEARKRLLAQARRDDLTGLPNRVTLHELVDQAIRDQREFALLFMDIDHFKDVNDSLGHGAGDRLLREAAQRLSRCVSAGGTVTRYGGDEFVAMLTRPHQDGRLTALLGHIGHAFETPVQIDDMQLRVQMSIGVVCYPEDGADAEALLKHADLAMYQVKTRGRNGVERFKQTLASAADQRIALSRRLRDAVEHHAFELAYQPQVDVRSHRVSGVEALIRWRDPEFGSVSPATFIPIAEENGMIGPMGEWVLRTACAQARQWERDLPGMRMSVNVSPRQLARPDFADTVRRALASSELAPNLLELEITEGALVAPGALPTLRALGEIGVSIAIDDFGTGYSSLSYLRTFHADRLKIDMSFVRGIGASRADEAIIRAILALARSLGFQIVAEGVERGDQLAFLTQYGCPVVQGFLFSAALPAEQIPRCVANLSKLSLEHARHSNKTAAPEQTSRAI